MGQMWANRAAVAKEAIWAAASCSTRPRVAPHGQNPEGRGRRGFALGGNGSCETELMTAVYGTEVVVQSCSRAVVRSCGLAVLQSSSCSLAVLHLAVSHLADTARPPICHLPSAICQSARSSCSQAPILLPSSAIRIPDSWMRLSSRRSKRASGIST